MVKFIVILYAIFALLLLLPSPSTQLNQFTYEDPEAGLDLLDDDKSNDGTIILRFGKPLININGSTACWTKTIYLRIIHPNASISFFSISNHSVPDFNFCLKDGSTRDYTTIWGFDQELILLTYYNSSNVTTSAIMGLFITFEGKVISTTKLHDALIDYGGILKYWLVIPISSPSDGFLFYCRGASVISWIHYSAPKNDGEVIERARSGIIKTNIKVVTVTAFYVLERGFAIVYGGDDSPSNLNYTTNINSFNFGTTNGVYIMFYYLTTNMRTGPFLLYQFPTQTLKSNNSQALIQTTKLRGLICSVDFDGAGNICMLILTSQYNITNTTSQPTLLKISYLSSGSVTKIGEMANVNFTYGFNLIPLRFGGYLMIVYQDNLNFGYVLDESGNVYSNWSLPQPLVLPQHISEYVVLANNSIVIVENQNNSIWNVTRDDLYRFYGQDNNEFNNPIIASTSPIIGSRVNESTRQLQFTFTYPVTLSSSNISIYQQINGSNDLLRQRFQGDSSSQLCRPDPNDNKTVIVQVIPSTFNEPNSLYYVTIENDFVKRSDTNEALLGLDKNLWTLITDSKQTIYSSQITGVIRLTPDGSDYYLSLSSVDKQKFQEQLATDLSSIIPVEDNRLTAADGLEKDTSTGSLQILLPFIIKDTTDLSKKSSNKISQDFNILLTYKEYSALMDYNTTVLIDKTYPMTIVPLLLRDYSTLIIIIALASIVLIIMYFLASRKFKKARNISIFKLIFIVIDLGLRISFLVNDARKVPELYLPTLIILIMSMSINTITSLVVTVHEIGKNPDFNKWFSKYGQFLPILTIISAGHVEALNVLTSKFGMLDIFCTNFSEVAEKSIFFAGISCLFACEIPQFIIQRKNNIIPHYTSTNLNNELTRNDL
ncbi:1482_t:CDS:10 [Dentiscutata erythropus]|uniref:1482_t:CDS:1 n=1 Tax=Dentiscutata erythropus TaxID=1348616 RepID=A0A9N9DYY5_9GLOM|nr:1482_t:CDS:10 [Dentiscutata erythropus]